MFRILRKEGERQMTIIKSLLENNSVVLNTVGNGSMLSVGDSFSGLSRALGLSPDRVIEEIKRSGLRGRGGAGYPTGLKWRQCADEAKNGESYVVANALDSDQRAPIGRFLAEECPMALIEGVMLAAYAVGAKKAYVCINEGYDKAAERLKEAAEKAKAAVPGIDTEIEFLKLKSELGEETVLIRDIEGKTRMPSLRPPYPSTSGINGKPTLVNSAETLVCAAAVMRAGADAFKSVGEPDSPGTKLFGVCGAVSGPGLYEVPMGTTLKELLEAAGVNAEKPLKAILVGGTAGAFVSPEQTDMHLDYEGIAQKGGVIGSSVIYVANESDCIVDLSYNCLTVSNSRSCGKCVLCREGTYQLKEMLKDITEGKAKPEDLDLMVEIGESMRAGAFCGMGRSAANPVLTALSLLKDEFEAHIRRKKCDAMVCKKYVSFFILPEKCQGCEKCLDVCPEDAIDGEEDMIHVIDQTGCTRCGKCFDVCPPEYSAVVKAGAVKPQVPKKPIPVGSWKKR